ncbi:MAG: hypothetical protein ACRBFS_11945 [Aureispira sp.]
MKTSYYLLFLFFFLMACKPSTVWVTYENPTFQYTIKFPEKPTIETRQINTFLGQAPAEMASAFEYSSPNRNNIFTVSCTTLPNIGLLDSVILDVDNIAKGMIEGLLERFQGELLYEKEIEVATYSAKEFRIEFDNPKVEGTNHMTVRVFMKGNLQFIIQTISEKEKNTQASIDQFMNSFAWIE